MAGLRKNENSFMPVDGWHENLIYGARTVIGRVKNQVLIEPCNIKSDLTNYRLQIKPF